MKQHASAATRMKHCRAATACCNACCCPLHCSSMMAESTHIGVLYFMHCTLQGNAVRCVLIGVMCADAPDVYPLGMMGFLLWDANSTDIGALFCSALSAPSMPS